MHDRETGSRLTRLRGSPPHTEFRFTGLDVGESGYRVPAGTLLIQLLRDCATASLCSGWSFVLFVVSVILWVSFSYMCAVTVGTDVYRCEVRIHLLTPLGVGNNIHIYIRTMSNFICICARYIHAAAI